eukprot:scaffold224049_cov32-Tisochrysis_lutea.AAC.2
MDKGFPCNDLELVFSTPGSSIRVAHLLVTDGTIMLSCGIEYKSSTYARHRWNNHAELRVRCCGECVRMLQHKTPSGSLRKLEDHCPPGRRFTKENIAATRD